jgi:Flp pilus assembly protein CpaB
VAAVLAAAAVGLAVHELAPPPAPTVAVVVATRDVAVGEPLGPDNLRAVRLPVSAVPPGAVTDVASLSGSRAVVPMGPQEVVTPAKTLVGSLLAGAGDDEVAVFVPVTEPALLGLLAAGTEVDLLSTADGSLLAAAARVLTVPVTADEWSVSAGGGGVLVAVDRAEAARLAAGSALPGPSVSLVIRPDSPAVR